MEVKVINSSNNELPKYETDGAAGMDLRAAIEQDIVLKPLERALIPTGLKMSIPNGYEGQIRPRSGLAWKSGVTVCNSPGCIDSDFRGQLHVILINLSNTDFTINPGERIAQLVFKKVEHVDWNEVKSLDSTERGEGGFGHTGTK